MRDDMQDILLNTGRFQAKTKNRKWDGEDETPFEGRRFAWAGGYHPRERQGDRLSPLKKFLAAHYGRPWDKVWSEICEANDNRTLRGFHLRQHVKNYVAQDVLLIDDVPHTPGWRGYFPTWLPWVHPKTGILQAPFEKKPRARKQEDLTHIPVDSNRSYEKMDGIWFEVTRQLVDGYDRTCGHWGPHIEYKKRQLSTKELRSLGIVNNPKAA